MIEVKAHNIVENENAFLNIYSVVPKNRYSAPA